MSARKPQLQRLEALVGEWDLEILRPDTSDKPIRGHSTFEWMVGGQFLVKHWIAEHPDFPEWLVVIGPDAGDDFIFHYFDSRGVTRTFHMTLGDGSWTLSREDPDFYQRFDGTFSRDGTSIKGVTTMSHDQGQTWKHDFDMTYTKVQQRS